MILSSSGFEPEKKTTSAKRTVFGIIIAALILVIAAAVIFLPKILNPSSNISTGSSDTSELNTQMSQLLTKDIGFQFLGSPDGQFNDAQLAAYSVVKMENYNWETGNTLAEYDAVTQKHFNKKITDYTGNGMTEAFPGSTDCIRAVGWGYETNYHAVARSLTKKSQNRYVGQFYCLHVPYSFDEGWTYTDEQAEAMLSEGNWEPFVQYGRKPALLEVTFTVGHDPDGTAYPIYESVKILQTDLTAPISSQ